VGEGTAVAVTGTLGAERAAGLSSAGEVGRLHRLAAPMGEGTAAATEGEPTMLAGAAT
jgi:3-hydroxyisobutyrate dehydrogenase-like beta-hydroxyacid dehydrogenase